MPAGRVALGVEQCPMPWCDECSRFYNPATLSESGDCPDGHRVADPAESAPTPKVPWHFWVLVIGIVLYLGWRAVQGIEWLIS